jgi:hypothetical protein
MTGTSSLAKTSAAVGKTEQSELEAFEKDTEEFYIPCFEVSEVGEDGYTHKYGFKKNSALLGTLYEKLFHQKCTDYFKTKKKDKKKSVNKLLKLNIPSHQISKLQDLAIELDYNLTDKDIEKLEALILANSPKVEKELQNYVKKEGKKAIDLDNMYLTKESLKDENRVDTIQSISNNNEDAEEGENKLVMCLKRYKGDEDRCFPPRKRDKSTYCQVPECYNPMLVIGSCTISAYDSEPYFFEMLAHFVIKKHPANPKRRIIYYNLEDEPRNCESDPAYFNNILEIRRTKRYIELKNNEISLTKTNEVVLTPEQEKEYADLEKLIVKLEDELGVINPAPGENTVDYHAVSEKQNDDLMEARKTYNEFKKIIRDNIIKKKEAEIKILEEKLKKMEDELAGRGSNTGKVSKKICLKYNYENSSVLPKLLYEDDRRNLLKGYKSDWFIEKVFDDEGEETWIL